MGTLKEILNECGFTFNKQFGQNFLTDTNLLAAIVKDAGITKEDYVVEVGAGAGALTSVLAANCRHVRAYEIDRRLMPVLERTVTAENAEIVFADVMKQDYGQLEQTIGCPYAVVANLPYYISTPFITTVCEQSRKCVSLTVMVQQEVADRIAAKENTKDYGALTVAVQSVADVTVTRKVSRNMFVPAPNVDSAVVHIRFDRDKYAIADRKMLRAVTKAAFAMRRKTLFNNLSAHCSKDNVRRLLALTNIDPSVRGETLSVKQFAALSDAVCALRDEEADFWKD